MKEIQLPLTSKSWAFLNAPFPLNETMWNQMINILNAMKPALVSNQTEEQQSEIERIEHE